MFWSLFGVLWISGLTQGSAGELLPREEVLSWFRVKVLDGLGVEEPPVVQRGPDEDRRQRGTHVHRRSGTGRVDRHGDARQETTQIILFPSSDPPCAPPEHSPSRHFTYFFKPSVNHHDSLVTSAQLWFYTGVPLNSSAPVFMLTSGQRLLQASPAPSLLSRDGWSTYYLDQDALKSMGQGSFLLQVHCLECECYSEPDKTPFLNLQVQSRDPKTRKTRSAPIPWSPSVLDLLQRPSQETHGDCHRAHIEVNFDELGWGNWIVHPKSLTFYYCHGNCSSPDRTAASLGMTQCCAPVPGSMRSLRITTTSDGGYSFKYETLPNIIPEECACI